MKGLLRHFLTCAHLCKSIYTSMQPQCSSHKNDHYLNNVHMIWLASLVMISIFQLSSPWVLIRSRFSPRLRMWSSCCFYLGTPVVAITQYQMFSQFCIHDQNHMEPLGSAGSNSLTQTGHKAVRPQHNNQNEMDQRQNTESITQNHGLIDFLHLNSLHVNEYWKGTLITSWVNTQMSVE